MTIVLPPCKRLIAFFAVLVLAMAGEARLAAEASPAATTEPAASVVRIDNLDLSKLRQDQGEVHVGESFGGKPMAINGKSFRYGLGTTGPSRLVIDLKGAATKFTATAGIDDDDDQGTASFRIFVDGREAFNSDVMKARQAGKEISVDLTDADRMMLVVEGSGHADWADAGLTLAAGAREKPQTSDADADAAGAMLSRPPPHSMWVDQMDLSKMAQEYDTPKSCKSVGGKPLAINGKNFEHGVGSHAKSVMEIDLKGVATKFHAAVGVDDELGYGGRVTFTVVVDGKVAVDTKLIQRGDDAQVVEADLKGARHLTLKIGDGGFGNGADHADWCDAYITLIPDAKVKPETTQAEAP